MYPEDNTSRYSCQVPVLAASAATSLVPYKANAPCLSSVPDAPVCRYAAWSWLNTVTGEIREFNCSSWSCPVHARKVAYRWALRIARSHPERMITLTDIPRDKRQAYLSFQHLTRDIRHAGFGFEYARFLEAGSVSGMLHWHLAQIGSYIPQAFLSSRASANGLGRVADIRKCSGQGPSFYLAKYITKDAAPDGWRKVTVSRGYPQPEPSPVSSGIWILRRGELN